MVRFRVVSSLPIPAEHDAVYLWPTGWDDWFKFSTLFNVAYIDPTGQQHHIGGTKIGSFGLEPAGKEAAPRFGYRSPALPYYFIQLGEELFSLGQDISYYEALTDVSTTFREDFLRAMNDLAYDPELLERAKAEQVTRVSLLREVPLTTVRDQFRRLAHGGARLTQYHFSFSYGWAGTEPINVDFSVDPNSKTPSNIHVLIGRNGVGKSTFLNAFAQTMVLGSRGSGDESEVETRRQMSNVVSVSFSAFDEFEPVSVTQDRTKGITYHYVGLKKVGSKKGAALLR